MSPVATCVCILLAILPCVSSHAYVYWPAARNLKIAPHVAHCFNVPGPDVNFQSAHNEGGKAGPSDFAKGLCGYFGDYRPVANIADDKIANWDGAVPVEDYLAGGPITFTIVMHAEHGGQFEFRLCDRKLNSSIGTREDAAACLDANFLGRVCVPGCGCDSDRCGWDNPTHNSRNDPIYSHGPPHHLQMGGHQVTLQLPAGLTCETCTIQWFWHTAWGEQFWNCIDIRIKAGGDMPTPALPPPSTVAPVSTPAPAPTPACKQLCGKTDLVESGAKCEDFGDDSSKCVASYYTKAGKSMPCRKTSCSCFADGETLLDCANLDDICSTMLLATA